MFGATGLPAGPGILSLAALASVLGLGPACESGAREGADSAGVSREPAKAQRSSAKGEGEAKQARAGRAAPGASPDADAAALPGVGGQAGAEALAQALADPARRSAAILALRPPEPAYARVFVPDFAAALRGALEKEWARGEVQPGPWGPEQSAQRVFSARADTLEAGAPGFPRAYKKIAAYLRPEAELWAIRFVRPGEAAGASFDAFAFVDGRWVYFPRAWRLVPADSAGSGGSGGEAGSAGSAGEAAPKSPP